MAVAFPGLRLRGALIAVAGLAVATRRAANWCAFALLVAAGGLPALALAQDADTVTLNFVNADIDAVVKAAAEITGRNFILDPRVKGTINIVSARPVPRSLVLPTLLSALRMQGFAAVESQGVTKIVPEAEAKQQAGPVSGGPVTATGDQLVTRVITLRNESAAQLVNVLRPLISPNNAIAAYPAANALIITDYADNLKRIERIVATLDQPLGGEPVVVPVKYASALDVVALVNRLSAEAPGAAPELSQRVMLIADPRSNSILLRSDNPGRVARIRQLIEQLDTPQRAGGNVFIIYLKNADAARVAETLRGLYGGGASTASGAAPALVQMAAAPTAVAGMTPVSALASSPAASSPLAASSTAAPGAFAAGGATIQADIANNALLIMAPEPVYNNLRAVIEKLDVRRAQVYVEALIVEVSADKAAEFGIQWQALTGYNTTQTRVIGGTNFTPRGSGSNIIDIAANPNNAATGLNLGVMRGTVSIPGLGTIANLAFLARALETQVGANILSTPTLLTLDNEEARILVGQNIPILTGAYSTTGSATTVTPFQTFERRDVGLILRVKPQIAEGGAVRLVLYQEVSRVDDTATTSSSGGGVVLSKRVLESSVMVDDGQIVVLGGLIQDQLNDGSDKVPLLGDIPGAGALFRYDARHRTKTNLLIFLKPTVLRSAEDGRSLTSERYEYLLNEQGRQELPFRLFWNDPSQPKLPPAGLMPGTPGIEPTPPLLIDKPPAVPPADPSKPPADRKP